MGNKKHIHNTPVESHDIIFQHIVVKVTVTAPADAPIIHYYNRKSFGCNKITEVKPLGTKTVEILAEDCTAYEAAREYQYIINRIRGFEFNNETATWETLKKSKSGSLSILNTPASVGSSE